MQNIIQYISKNLPGIFSFLLLNIFYILYPLTGTAQNKYTLTINLVDQDSAYTSTNGSAKLQPLALQTSFNNKALCSDYINRLPAILTARGYPVASVDSIHFDSSAAYIELFTGPRYKWLEIKTSSDQQKVLSQAGWYKNQFYNKRIDFGELQNRQNRILNYYQNSGYPFARVKLDSIQIEGDVIRATLNIDKGILYRIDSIRVYGKVKIRNSFLQRYTGIDKGSLYNSEKLQNVSKQLQKLPYLQEQQSSDVSMLGTGATLNLYLAPKKSSQANFLIGFLPGNTSTGKPQLTGDIHLDLNNSLAGGENILLNWQQLQRKSPRLNLGYHQPYAFNSAFGFDFAFDLLKRDSTYLLLNAQIGIQYLLSVNQSGKIFLQSQRAYLLEGGYDTTRIKISKTLPQDIDVSANSVGIDYEWINTNYRLNPRQGNEFKMVTTVGLKKITRNNEIISLKDPANAGFDFSSLYDSLKLKTYQIRFVITAAHYFPVGKKSTVKAGASSGIFQSQNIFRNELFQVGGYRLLRGFNEESIYASQYSVFTAEYRVLTGTNSYLFAFTDIGFTRTRFQLANFKNNFIGVGTGLSFETKFGLLNLSYAIGKRDDVKFDITNSSKIHFGYINYF